MISRNVLDMSVLCLVALFAFGTTAQAEDNKKAGPAKSAPAVRSPTPAARSSAPAVRAPVPVARSSAPAARAPVQAARSSAPATRSPAGPAHAAVHPGTAHERHEFHEHDVHRFNEVELTHWRGGRWNNSCFDGRCGWWWFAGGQSYFYERPIYPYPLVVSEVLFVEPVVVAVEPEVVAPVFATAPVGRVVQAPLSVAAAPQFWYYCDNPPGYYPYVANCNTQYRQVPVSPLGQH
jgi:hypothetical protein